MRTLCVVNQLRTLDNRIVEVEEPRRAKCSDAINMLPPSATVDSVMLDVGEHCDVIVEMNPPSEITTCKRSLDPRGRGGLRAIVRSASAPGSSRRTIPRELAKELNYNALRVRGNQVPTLSTLDIREISLE